ncbi:MAG: hypothetical protein KME56_01450 [Candidatus Thiodiazotropha sp. (ex Ctena orbiculata)]|uniref:Uncharacterized protein n=1 Tax=Candidatus Thiodiazotropha taylori TaxID=2792791 RepID=A0A944M8T4_9GAMM|nr:hypothetical protein [Candidatus Thiodiazotropha taylori]PUB89072.1 MAG: hypothetical protein DBP00_03740 [gamma proteobacterium symbiont of Ctena orbiculata]MBT2987458.1 hypothetical protein [Candidatus Thiodiazotropha taylori]MBT2995286.1 hypothetical protein [Candidatus Thiodiazotropha taylori]MBT3002896.1 hypothetical protein [Candidatus Thiodiazotropha taylori]
MDKRAQILAVHAAFINQVVLSGSDPDRKDEFEQLMAMAKEHGWDELVAVIRKIFNEGRRDIELLNNLDEEDQVITEAILHGLQDPSTLPDPNQKPDPTMAAPGLASMIHAAGSGNAQALQIIAEMADQMSRVGGPMARLAAVIRPLIDGERDPDLLCKRMDRNTESMVLGILDELKRLEEGSD